MTEQSAATQMPRWAESLMRKHAVTEPPLPGVVPEWLRSEIEATPLWYIIREAKEIRRSHPYLLIEEVRKQPNQWREILSTLRPAIAAVADLIIERGTDEIILTGCGSAFFTAIHGEFVIERLAGIRCRAVESFELRHYFPAVDPTRTVVIAHSGTGGSIEIREALKKARAQGCLTIAITNTPGSPLEQIAEKSLCYETAQGCGPCITVISTRILIQTLLGLDLGKRFGGAKQVAHLESQIAHCPDIGDAFLHDQEQHVRSLAEQYKDTSRFSWSALGRTTFPRVKALSKSKRKASVYARRTVRVISTMTWSRYWAQQTVPLQSPAMNPQILESPTA